MQISRLCSIALLVSAACSMRAAALNDPLVISSDCFFVGGITIGATPKEAQAAFGPPLLIFVEPSPTFCKEELTEHYQGIRAEYCDGKLVNLLCSTPSFKTPSGIKVGMTAKEVVKRQGNTIVRSDSGKETLRYQVATPDRTLIIHLKKGMVTAIELWFDFT